MAVCSHWNRINPFMVAMRDILLGFIAIFGYLYYCYKFGSPDLGNNDFYQYQKMVEHPFDLSATSAPFVLRQVPTFVAHLFYMYGIFYDTKTNLDLIISGAIETKKVFFALILSNAIAAAVSFAIALTYIRQKVFNNDILVCFSYLGVVLSYFFVPFSIIAPLSYGWGWLTSTILAVAFLERRFLMFFLGCILALMTRETILVFMLVLSAFAWVTFGHRDRFHLRTALMAGASCALLIILRRYVVHGYEQQFSLQSVMTNFLSFELTKEFLFQSILPQALIVVLLVSLLVSHRMYALALIASLFAVTLLGIGTGITSTGRLLGEALPIYAIVFVLAKLGGLGVAPTETIGKVQAS